jgi:protein-S-isoprenylcysteine O-methyltransferase Ste14
MSLGSADISPSPPKNRGDAWVAAQFALMAVTIGLGFLPPEWPDSIDRPLDWAGAACAILGANLIYLSARALGGSLTAFPQPREGGELVTRGPYRRARHPIYGGGLLFFLGWALYSAPLALLGLTALAALWTGKSNLEERLLAERYPDYESYRRETPRRFVPFIA